MKASQKYCHLDNAKFTTRNVHINRRTLVYLRMDRI